MEEIPKKPVNPRTTKQNTIYSIKICKAHKIRRNRLNRTYFEATRVTNNLLVIPRPPNRVENQTFRPEIPESHAARRKVEALDLRLDGNKNMCGVLFAGVRDPT